MARIYVLAGVNGAGKSSIGGAMLRSQGVPYFNPDEVAARIRAVAPGLSLAEAQSAAWIEGRKLLERAIAQRLDYAFETTLGGRSITALLVQAARQGIEIWVWYVGLANIDLHLARVKSRVARGGHDIPEERIRGRYAPSLLNLMRLLPLATELRVYDNSYEADPNSGQEPRPKVIVHLRRGRIVAANTLSTTPDWAKPIMLAALEAAVRTKDRGAQSKG